MTEYTSAKGRCSGEDSGLKSPRYRLPKIVNEVETEFAPKQIRKVMEMYLKGIPIEVSLNGNSNRYTAAMRGLFHCEKCMKLWYESKQNINCGNNQKSLISGEVLKFGKEEALHIIKMTSSTCYSDDDNITQILNKMNQNIDGTFISSAGRSANRFRNDYSPILYSTSCGRKIPGTFIFSMQKYGSDEAEIFSPYFNIPITVRGVKPNKRTFPIFEVEKKSNSKGKRNPTFCTVAGKTVDARKIFTSGLLGCFANWEIFYSGEMSHDSFVPTACVLDSGIVLFWPRENRKSRKVTFESLDEVLELTKQSFPCFPEDKLIDRKGAWTLISGRKFCDMPAKLRIRRRVSESRSLATLYLGGPEKSLMKNNKRFKIEYHAFRESADFISRASSDTDDSFSEEIEKAVKPSGLPMELDEMTTVSGNSLNIGEREVGGKESYTRRPSVAWFREVTPSEERDMLQRRSNSAMRQSPVDAINPAVKNRTGKPITRPGQLSDGTTVSAIKIGGETTQITPKPMPVLQRKASNLKPSDLHSQTTISKDFEASRQKSIRQAEGRVSTPTAAKRVTRNEFKVIKPKEKSTLPKTAEGPRVPTMKQHTGEIRSMPPAKKRDTLRDRIDSPVQEMLDDREKKTSKSKSIEIVETVSNNVDDREFTLPSEHYLPRVEEKKKKRLTLPSLNDHTVLNFTESYRFSYFMMPAYVKEKNEKIRNGLFKLPVIKQDLSPHIRKSKDRSDLMKRIEKLNKFHGSTDARIRQ